MARRRRVHGTLEPNAAEEERLQLELQYSRLSRPMALDVDREVMHSIQDAVSVERDRLDATDASLEEKFKALAEFRGALIERVVAETANTEPVPRAPDSQPDSTEERLGPGEKESAKEVPMSRCE